MRGVLLSEAALCETVYWAGTSPTVAAAAQKAGVKDRTFRWRLKQARLRLKKTGLERPSPHLVLDDARWVVLSHTGAPICWFEHREDAKAHLRVLCAALGCVMPPDSAIPPRYTHSQRLAA